MRIISKALCTGLVALLLAGCTTRHYRASADKEAAAIIAEKTPLVPGMDKKFTIQTNKPPQLDDLPVNQEKEEAFGADADKEVGSHILSLEKTLDIAVKHSRTYQARKETLYLQALALSLARHRYTPLFSGSVGGKYSSTRYVESGVDTITEERQVNFNGRVGMNYLLMTGARLSTSFTTDFIRFLTGDPRWTTSSAMGASLTQPLLRGAGYRVAIENLTQAERDLLYALRDFSRYRKEFSIEIADAFYRVLQNRDSVLNSWRGFQNFKSTAEREKAFADEGQRPLASLGQLRQAELETESQWNNAVRSYFQALDQFKLQLGLPLSAKIMLDPSELTRLTINHPNLVVDEAIEVALQSRLDLQNEQDSLADSDRKVYLAKNALKPGLDLVTGVNVPSQGNNKYAPDFERYSWYAGLEADLPFDRKSERNSYRGALISRERAARELVLATDNIRLQIVDGWRNLDQAKRNYEISEIGVKLSEQRVEEETLKQELGRGLARDLVDAQTALIRSKNNLTSAVISHTMARLKFWRDMGILMIKDNGQWEDLKDANTK